MSVVWPTITVGTAAPSYRRRGHDQDGDFRAGPANTCVPSHPSTHLYTGACTLLWGLSGQSPYAAVSVALAGGT